MYETEYAIPIMNIVTIFIIGVAYSVSCTLEKVYYFVLVLPTHGASHFLSCS